MKGFFVSICEKCGLTTRLSCRTESERRHNVRARPHSVTMRSSRGQLVGYMHEERITTAVSEGGGPGEGD